MQDKYRKWLVWKRPTWKMIGMEKTHLKNIWCGTPLEVMVLSRGGGEIKCNSHIKFRFQWYLIGSSLDMSWLREDSQLGLSHLETTYVDTT